MFRRFFIAATMVLATVFVLDGSRADDFSLQEWGRIEDKAARNDAHAAGLRDGYLAGVRDALRFYSKVSRTFPICWPKDHEVDDSLVRDTVNAVLRQHPDIAKPEDNFAYVVVLSLYDAYPCR